MKKHAVLSMCSVFALMWLPCFAVAVQYLPGAGLERSVHDLRSTNQGFYQASDQMGIPIGSSQDRICVWCHVPHHTIRYASYNGFSYFPLWNHDLTTNIDHFSTYYNGPDAPLTGSKALQSANDMIIGSVSLLCLSCHDGSIAVNAYGNSFQNVGSMGGGGSIIRPEFRIGFNGQLENHHPIGFNYDAVAAIDTEIRSADNAAFNSSFGEVLVRDVLYNGRMECATCHSVHNRRNSGDRLLWSQDRNSDFCFTCHMKDSSTNRNARNAGGH